MRAMLTRPKYPLSSQNYFYARRTSTLVRMPDPSAHLSEVMVILHSYFISALVPRSSFCFSEHFP